MLNLYLITRTYENCAGKKWQKIKLIQNSPKENQDEKQMVLEDVFGSLKYIEGWRIWKNPLPQDISKHMLEDHLFR